MVQCFFTKHSLAMYINVMQHESPNGQSGNAMPKMALLSALSIESYLPRRKIKLQ